MLEQLKHRRLHLEKEEEKLEEQYVRMQQCMRTLAHDTEEDQYPCQGGGGDLFGGDEHLKEGP